MIDEEYCNVKIKSNDLGKRARKNTKKSKGLFSDVDFKKSLGQNFLSDKNLLTSIANIAEVKKDDYVLEIGAGAGTLTSVLSENAKEVISYEIDRSLKEKLNAIAETKSNLKLIFDDFMNCDLNTIFSNKKFKVVANIPYYITTPIIFKLFEISDRISLMLFMVQKEVAERFASKEGNKSYGITSIILQSVADVSCEKIVKKECFTPMPKVDSALIKIVFNKNKYNINNFEKFSEFVHISFGMRRKTLLNNILKKYDFSKEILQNYIKKLGYEETVRPEQISVDNYIKLTNKLFK